MKIFDCFMFFDEEMLLDVRLNELNKFVDKFIITESTYTHSGKPKKLLFDIKKYSKFKNKIKYIIVDQQPEGIVDILNNEKGDKTNSKYIQNAIKRENFQRNCLIKGLSEAEKNDFVLISDLDEIPNLKKIDLNKIKNKLVFFKQKNFYYKFNLYIDNLEWYGSKGCKFKNLESPQWLRNIKGKKYSFLRLDTLFSKNKYQNIKLIEDGGWHFSYLKNAKGIEEKLKSYLHHREYDMEPLGIDRINQMIKSNMPVYNLKTDKLKSKFTFSDQLKTAKNEELPDYVQKNIEKYNQWFA